MFKKTFIKSGQVQYIMHTQCLESLASACIYYLTIGVWPGYRVFIENIDLWFYRIYIDS